LKEDSFAHQGCIYLIQITVKTALIYSLDGKAELCDLCVS